MVADYQGGEKKAGQVPTKLETRNIRNNPHFLLKIAYFPSI